MARIPDDLIGRCGDLAVGRRRPVALDRLADDDDRPAIRRVDVIHRLERADDLVVIVSVGHRHHVPPVRFPLLDEIVAGVLRVDDAAHERVVDARVVFREHDAKPLADLQRERLRLQLLRVTGAQRELAFEGDHLGLAHGRAHHVPERGLPGCARQAHPRRSAVDVIALVDRLDMARQRVNAAAALFRLREQRLVGEPLLLKQRLERARTAPESERVDGEEPVFRRHVVFLVAGRLELPVERLAHDHPQRITRGRAVARGEHELVAVGMFRTPVVVPQAAELRPGEVHRDVVGRIGKRPAEVAGL